MKYRNKITDLLLFLFLILHLAKCDFFRVQKVPDQLKIISNDEIGNKISHEFRSSGTMMANRRIIDRRMNILKTMQNFTNNNLNVDSPMKARFDSFSRRYRILQNDLEFLNRRKNYRNNESRRTVGTSPSSRIASRFREYTAIDKSNSLSSRNIRGSGSNKSNTLISKNIFDSTVDVSNRHGTNSNSDRRNNRILRIREPFRNSQRKDLGKSNERRINTKNENQRYSPIIRIRTTYRDIRRSDLGKSNRQRITTKRETPYHLRNMNRANNLDVFPTSSLSRNNKETRKRISFFGTNRFEENRRATYTKKSYDTSVRFRRNIEQRQQNLIFDAEQRKERYSNQYITKRTSLEPKIRDESQRRINEMRVRNTKSRLMVNNKELFKISLEESPRIRKSREFILNLEGHRRSEVLMMKSKEKLRRSSQFRSEVPMNNGLLDNEQRIRKLTMRNIEANSRRNAQQMMRCLQMERRILGIDMERRKTDLSLRSKRELKIPNSEMRNSRRLIGTPSFWNRRIGFTFHLNRNGRSIKDQEEKYRLGYRNSQDNLVLHRQKRNLLQRFSLSIYPQKHRNIQRQREMRQTPNNAQRILTHSSLRNKISDTKATSPTTSNENRQYVNVFRRNISKNNIRTSRGLDSEQRKNTQKEKYIENGASIISQRLSRKNMFSLSLQKSNNFHSILSQVLHRREHSRISTQKDRHTLQSLNRQNRRMILYQIQVPQESIESKNVYRTITIRKKSSNYPNILHASRVIHKTHRERSIDRYLPSPNTSIRDRRINLISNRNERRVDKMTRRDNKIGTRLLNQLDGRRQAIRDQRATIPKINPTLSRSKRRVDKMAIRDNKIGTRLLNRLDDRRQTIRNQRATIPNFNSISNRSERRIGKMAIRDNKIGTRILNRLDGRRQTIRDQRTTIPKINPVSHRSERHVDKMAIRDNKIGTRLLNHLDGRRQTIRNQRATISKIIVEVFEVEPINIANSKRIVFREFRVPLQRNRRSNLNSNELKSGFQLNSRNSRFQIIRTDDKRTLRTDFNANRKISDNRNKVYNNIQRSSEDISKNRRINTKTSRIFDTLTPVYSRILEGNLKRESFDKIISLSRNHKGNKFESSHSNHTHRNNSWISFAFDALLGLMILVAASKDTEKGFVPRIKAYFMNLNILHQRPITV